MNTVPQHYCYIAAAQLCAASLAINDFSFMVKDFTGTKLRNKCNHQQEVNNSGFMGQARMPVQTGQA